MGLVALVGSFVLLLLLIFRASTWACLFCFTTHEERLSLCRMFVGSEDSKIRKCRDALTDAFEGFSDMEINYDERSHLHDEFTQMTVFLQEVAAVQGSFWKAFTSAAAKLKRTIEHLKKAQDCIPPCVQDMLVNRGDQALFSCIVAFQLPESEVTYSWKYAGGGVRTQDVSYFRDLPGSHGYLARIRPVQPRHSGTFSCVILHDQRPLARLYFYLNVTGPPPPEETELQVTFREVMRWTPREAEMIQPWRPSLGELLTRPQALTPGNLLLLAAAAALGSASVTVLVWLLIRWYLSGN
ncbi:sperm acrosome membrane-associated protein 6 isoform X5 [Rattus norvegicus]|uniref:Sperm acrosome associated 6 n=2 Tax=Rattus norvegicus TaxID=10116 RepID=A0ABK0M402_RAT|nr:sperm acrosome membrane-associated protein 6 isoform X6 [Rattus norvegicus]